MRSWLFTLIAVVVGAALFAVSRFIQNDYFFFAGYVVLQYIVLSTAWNILGGYCGYVNFGTAAFFALGAYTTVVLHKLTSLPLPVMMPIGGIVESLTATFYGPSWAPAVAFGFLLITLAVRPAGILGR